MYIVLYFLLLRSEWCGWGRMSIAIKTIRNKEDHTLDLKVADYLNVSGLITAIGGIVKIASIVYPKQDAA